MTLSPNKILLLRKFVNFICESCHKHEKYVGTLQPHRINQELNYNLRNIKMCCEKCHKIFTSAQNLASLK